MIEFPCHCGYRFSVPEELAGGSLQCPQCHWLNEIPTLGDLASILPDGTYIMDRPDPVPSESFGEKLRAFSRSTHDELGEPIDLRPTMRDIRRVGVGVTEPPPLEHPLQMSPKYDPETGELIRPLNVTLREEDALGAIPVAKAALSYALPGLHHRVNPARVYLELFRPANAIVMSFIFLFHLMIQAVMLVISVIVPLFGLAFLVVAVIGHYGCVVEEVGREERDEMPRPLRDLNLGEDIWFPFCNVMAGMMLCYFPALFAMAQMPPGSPHRLFVAASLLMLGTILIPAILLTLLTGGTFYNLRPDRVLGIIGIAGWSYIFLVIGWVIAIAIYVAGIIGLNYVVLVGWITKSAVVPKFYWVGTLLLLMGGIYLMHAFCWQLGLLYRAKHAQFSWVYQKHIRREKREKAA